MENDDQGDVRYLYHQTLQLNTKKGKVSFVPIAMPECNCVQYCRRIPSDKPDSVHYEVETRFDKEKIIGCRVVLHAERQTADGNAEACKKLIRHFREELRKRNLSESSFELGKSSRCMDLHSKDIIPVGTEERKFIDQIGQLLAELYDLVEDLLLAAERDSEYNPYGWDDIEEKPTQENGVVVLGEIDTVEPSQDRDLWSEDANGDRTHASVISVARLLKMHLRLPDYQRPYKWNTRNVGELLTDIEDAIAAAHTENGAQHYRLGTIIVHEETEDKVYKVVDGQQRLLTLSLLMMSLRSGREPLGIPLVDDDEETLRHLARQPESTVQLQKNYTMIMEYFGNRTELKKSFFEALTKTLQVVVIRVNQEDEAFQLFDSQNARGRALDPHDLLKAYHLRAMKMDGASDRQMRRRVMGWESVNPEQIRSLFDSYLFRIYNWSRGQKTHSFTVQDIGAFKGLSRDRFGRMYPFVKRAVAAGHEFQIGDDFAAGEGFFTMVDHYLDLREDVNALLDGDNPDCFGISPGALRKVKQVMVCKDGSGGYHYLQDLFRCALFCYADRFGVENLDMRVLSKLCRWAFAVMLDLSRMSEKTVNRYAIGSGGYSNAIPMFATIRKALQPIDIIGLSVNHKKGEDSLSIRLSKLEVQT